MPFISQPLYFIEENLDDDRLSGTRTSSGEWVVVLANTDDVAVLTKNQNELINEHLQLYEEVSSVKLNHSRADGVWFGPVINVHDRNDMIILDVQISIKSCYEKTEMARKGK